jgi:hypothetical protein
VRHHKSYGSWVGLNGEQVAGTDAGVGIFRMHVVDQESDKGLRSPASCERRIPRKSMKTRNSFFGLKYLLASDSTRYLFF